MIKKVIDKDNLLKLVKIIQKAYSTVANDFGLTTENTPTNPAFINEKWFFERLNLKDQEYFGFLIQNKIIACIAINLISEEEYGIERLAVLPEFRHQGIGTQLINHVVNYILKLNGKEISIGIIFENKTLLKWYEKQGFTLEGTKKFDHLPFTVGFMKKRLI